MAEIKFFFFRNSVKKKKQKQSSKDYGKEFSFKKSSSSLVNETNEQKLYKYYLYSFCSFQDYFKYSNKNKYVSLDIYIEYTNNSKNSTFYF